LPDSIFLKWIATIPFYQFSVLLFEEETEKHITKGTQNSWHKARDLLIFQVDLPDLEKNE